jgi:polar amino acid transport system substrate-binding protein
MKREGSAGLAGLGAALIAGLAAILCIFPSRLSAQPPAHRSLRVATRLVPPFVSEEHGQLQGFSIDLWRQIADQMGVEYQFQVCPTVSDLLSKVKSGQVDVGVAAISITSDREKELDFSQPMLQAGLQILVRQQSGGSRSIGGVLATVFSPTLLQLIGIILIVVLLPAHVVWFFERRRKEGIIRSHSYFPGILEACYWSASTLATQAEEMPKSAIGRAVAVVWMFCAVVFVAYFTAAVTSSLTVQELQGNIKGPDDLPGKRVATTAGSTSATYLREVHAQVLEFPQIDQVYQALLAGQADAAVYDAPVLLYYASHEGKGKVQAVGTVFRKESYGIAVSAGSPLRKQINHALLALEESGGYQETYDRWFASK